MGLAPSWGRTQKLSTRVGRRLESRSLASLSKGPLGAKLHGGFRRFGRGHELRTIRCAGFQSRARSFRQKWAFRPFPRALELRVSTKPELNHHLESMKLSAEPVYPGKLASLDAPYACHSRDLPPPVVGGQMFRPVAQTGRTQVKQSPGFFYRVPYGGQVEDVIHIFVNCYMYHSGRPLRVKHLSIP